MSILSLRDAGYKLLCPKEFPKAEGLNAALSKGGYEVIDGGDFLLCKPFEAEKRFLSLESSLSKNNFSEWPDIIRSLRFFYEPWFTPALEMQTNVKDSDIDGILRSFLEYPFPDSLYILASLLFWSHPKQLERILTKAAKIFFEKYPGGRLHFIRINSLLGQMQAVQRVITAVDAFGVDVMEKPDILEQRPSELLSNIHPGSLEPVIESVLQSLLSGFFRLTYGRCVSRIGGIIVLQIDPPAEYQPPYTRKRWDFNRLQGMFQGQTKMNLEEYLRTLEIPKEQQRDAYKRYVFENSWTAQEFELLLTWTVAQINKCFNLLLDLTNFTNKNGFVDFIKQRKIYLTVERIIVEINYILTEMDPFVRKLLYFNLHDKIASLSKPDAGLKERRIIFNRLFKMTHYQGRLRSLLSVLPSPFDQSFVKLGDVLFQELIDETLASVWARYRISKKGVFTREPSDEVDGFITRKLRDRRGGPYVPEDFAVNYLHAIRNSLHGYQLKSGGFEEFLVMHLGDISDSLPDLTIIWLFLLLSDLKGLLDGTWAQGISPRESSN